MKILTHALYAVFTWVYALFWVDWQFGMALSLFHMLPLVDILLKRFLKFEPLHTVWGYTITIVISFIFGKLIAFIYFVGITSHLLLDFFVKEGVRFLYPKKLVFTFPVPHADLIIQVGSCIGIIFCGLLLLL